MSANNRSHIIREFFHDWDDMYVHILSIVRNVKLSLTDLVYHYEQSLSESDRAGSGNAIECCESLIAQGILRVITESDYNELIQFLQYGEIYTLTTPGTDMFPFIGAIEYTDLGSAVAQVDAAIRRGHQPSQFWCCRRKRQEDKSLKPSDAEQSDSGGSCATLEVLASSEHLLMTQAEFILEYSFIGSREALRSKTLLRPKRMWRDHWWRTPQPMWILEMVFDGNLDITDKTFSWNF